ncbi:MAG: hypothetical protein C0608_08560 [Deltaproteobacteria bacterium]|nr:MAG: hypothetical protein C0608_08560 [Deltaproteobacteria bacterium]
MSEESRSHAINVVLPRFLKEGFAKEVEYTFIKKSGEPIDVLLSAIAERDEEGKIFRSIAVLIDVTERKRAERGLQKARKMLENYSRDLERQVRERTLEITNILKYTPAVVSLKDRDGRYLLVNSRFSEMFNIAADRVRGRSDEEIFPPEVAALLSGNDGRVLEKKEPFSVEERMEWEGAVGVYLSVKFPLFDEGGVVTGVGSISTDVTALKEAQEELRRLSSRVLEGQERERAAVARELHDELGQVLTALKMDAVWLSDRLKGGDEKAAAHALKMSENIDRTIDEVRGMVMSLRPGVLDDLGLIAALEWLSDEVERRTGIPCTFRHSDLPRLGSAAETAIYRIAQEALTNVARHSGAARAEVALKREEGNLILTVHDDGEGFEVGPEKQFESYGLSGIRERAELIGGIVEITSDSSGGTKVKFTLPIEGHIREIEN